MSGYNNFPFRANIYLALKAILNGVWGGKSEIPSQGAHCTNDPIKVDKRTKMPGHSMNVSL